MPAAALEVATPFIAETQQLAESVLPAPSCVACTIKIAWCINTLMLAGLSGPERSCGREACELCEALFWGLLSERGPDDKVDPVLLAEAEGKPVLFGFRERLELITRIDRGLLDRSEVLTVPSIRCLMWDRDRGTLTALDERVRGRVFEHTHETMRERFDEFIERVETYGRAHRHDRPAGVLIIRRQDDAILSTKPWLGPLDELTSKLEFLSPDTTRAMAAMPCENIPAVIHISVGDEEDAEDVIIPVPFEEDGPEEDADEEFLGGRILRPPI
jgi:hypothetical protein